MNIPNDKRGTWRRDQFIAYHQVGDADMNFPLLEEYADEHNLSIRNRFWLSFLYSTCYCVATTCFMFEKLDIAKVHDRMLNNFWEKYKPMLIFQTDKRYVKNMNCFVRLVIEFVTLTRRQPDKYFKHFKEKNPQETYDVLYKHVNSWWYFGRFTTFLLLEAFNRLTPLKLDSSWFDWKEGCTATSGMMHILYLDEEAEMFDSNGLLDYETKKRLDRALRQMRSLISKKYPETINNIADIETSLCGFRKLFKQSRYGGYYIDRVQDEIETMEKALPEEHKIWGSLWEYRKKRFDWSLLGELNGRKGIQKHRNSEWVERGVFTCED